MDGVKPTGHHLQMIVNQSLFKDKKITVHPANGTELAY